MRFKKVTWNWLSVLVGFHYGRNPRSGERFLHIGLGPFLGLDFYWPEDEWKRPVGVALNDSRKGEVVEVQVASTIVPVPIAPKDITKQAGGPPPSRWEWRS